MPKEASSDITLSMSGDSRHPNILCVSGRDLPVLIKRHPRARRIILRLDHAGEALSLVLPRGVSKAEGLAFAKQQEDWIRRRLSAVPPRIRFEPGARISILGREHEIRHNPFGRRGVWCESGVIWASGRPEHLPRRITDHLKQQARLVIAEKAREKAKSIDAKLGRISLRDTRSRWGSCSARGDVSFSWRLILAPEEVLDYVVAHEVAHLIEHNHSPEFWQLTARLTPHSQRAKAWLRANGNQLHRFG